MYITIIICVLLICATILGYNWLKLGYSGDETLETKFDAIKIKINNILAEDAKAEAEDKSYMINKESYRKVVSEIKQILDI